MVLTSAVLLSLFYRGGVAAATSPPFTPPPSLSLSLPLTHHLSPDDEMAPWRAPCL